jgi:cation:H+ antiporter
VLAAVGTALPETILPLVAILSGRSAGQSIGIGAILGSPFMLATLAMFVLAVAVLLFARSGRRGTELIGDRRVILQDLGYFLVMYALAVVAGLYHAAWFRWALVAALLVGYALYVRRHFASPGQTTEDGEAHGGLPALYLGRIVERARARADGSDPDPAAWISVSQSLVALLGMVGGAKLFVAGIDTVAREFGVPELALALLIAPFATELPEKFNSVLWARRGKDTLALGNLTGAMVFQSSFPVSVGLLLTPWKLTGDALAAAVTALAAGTVLWVTLRIRGTFGARLLLLQGVFYAGFVTYVIVRL